MNFQEIILRLENYGANRDASSLMIWKRGRDHESRYFSTFIGARTLKVAA